MSSIATKNKLESNYKKLLELINPDKDNQDRLKRAFQIALDTSRQGHELWNEQALYHMLEVARIAISEVSLGTTSVISILLTNPVIHNLITINRVKKEFGEVVSTIVNGLEKISDIISEKTASQAENFRRLMLNLAGDMRVILIKLAERLERMRRLEEEDERHKLLVANEAFYVFAPLAHRLGLYLIKSEMEDLAMKYMEYDTYKMIARKLKDTARMRNKFIKDFIKPIRDRLEDHQFDFEIKGRPKTIYSIYSKMKRQGVEFEDVYDKFAIRVILNSKPENEKNDCWQVYSLITEIYQPNPKRLRDWISVPKSNGYESLHTTVVVPGGQWVEVQIRTRRMDEIAEKGFAAHWKYKGGKNDGGGIDEWLLKIRDLLDSPEQDSLDLIDDFKLSLYAKEIFVFTPRGDLKKFPAGATVLDFAYEIHSQVGNNCMGAKVNGRSVPIRHILQNGDKVEIITSKNQKPKSDWLAFVVSSKAKSKIKIALKEEKMKEADLGKEMVKRRFKNWKIEYNDENIRKLIQHYKYNTAIDLYSDIAQEKLDVLQLKDILNMLADKREPDLTFIEPEAREQKSSKHEDVLVIDEKMDQVAYKLAKCCNPIFGDDIFGFVTVGEGIKIHRTNCPNAKDLIYKYEYRIIKARWSGKEDQSSYQAGIRFTVIDEMGILNKISEVIAKDAGVNLRSINIDKNDSMLEGNLKVWVNNTNHLEGLIKRLKNVKGVLSVARTD